MPVLDFLSQLRGEARGRVDADIDFLASDLGLELGEPTYKHLRGRIWEIRTPTREGAIRVLFAADGGDAVLLHAFKKKTQRLPAGDLEAADRRYADYVARKGK